MKKFGGFSKFKIERPLLSLSNRIYENFDTDLFHSHIKMFESPLPDLNIISNELKKHEISLAEQYLAITAETFYELVGIIREYLEYIKADLNCLNTNMDNSERPESIKNASTNDFATANNNSSSEYLFEGLNTVGHVGLSISPMRFDFLIKRNENKDVYKISDINLPGSFAMDSFWFVYNKEITKEKETGNKAVNINYHGRYAGFNPYLAYSHIFTKYHYNKPVITRYLDLQHTKSLKQLDFIDNMFRLLSESYKELFEIRLSTEEITEIDENKDSYRESDFLSAFLNTHNSPANLIKTFKHLTGLVNCPEAENKGLFIDPHLIKYTDKKPPESETLIEYLGKKDARNLILHLPNYVTPKKIKTDEEQSGLVVKRRLGHAGSSIDCNDNRNNDRSNDSNIYPNNKSQKNGTFSLYSEISVRKPFEFDEIGVEKLEGFRIGDSIRLVDSNADPLKSAAAHDSYHDFIFEISITSLIIMKMGKIVEILPVIGVEARGAKQHPISGPHTLIFPVLIDIGTNRS